MGADGKISWKVERGRGVNDWKGDVFACREGENDYALFRSTILKQNERVPYSRMKR